jgi:hypothetical protein
MISVVAVATLGELRCKMLSQVERNVFLTFQFGTAGAYLDFAVTESV